MPSSRRCAATGSPEAGDVRLSDLEPFLFGGLEWPRLVFVNGEFAPDLSTTTGLAPRVSPVRAWREAMKADALGRADPADGDRRYRAAMRSPRSTPLCSPMGSSFTCPAGVALDRPLQILYVSTAEAAKGVSYPRTLVVADAQRAGDGDRELRRAR